MSSLGDCVTCTVSSISTVRRYAGAYMRAIGILTSSMIITFRAQRTFIHICNMSTNQNNKDKQNVKWHSRFQVHLCIMMLDNSGTDLLSTENFSRVLSLICWVSYPDMLVGCQSIYHCWYTASYSPLASRTLVYIDKALCFRHRNLLHDTAHALGQAEDHIPHLQIKRKALVQINDGHSTG